MTKNPNIEFEILIDEAFVNINTNKNLDPIDNKRVLSLINDFEDGEWRYSKFQKFVWDNISETSLSYKERESLIVKPHSSLVASAKNIRLTDKEEDIGKGSELAEIVLYGIMKHYYNALPVVPKIFYKQNIVGHSRCTRNY
ncbi:MAG: Hachiman antiphage defense system protein HamA [Candidatus Methanoperedens sp.]